MGVIKGIFFSIFNGRGEGVEGCGMEPDIGGHFKLC